MDSGRWIPLCSGAKSSEGCRPIGIFALSPSVWTAKWCPKRDFFVTSLGSDNHVLQPHHHNHLPETCGLLWIHRGVMTNQRCPLATMREINNGYSTPWKWSTTTDISSGQWSYSALGPLIWTWYTPFIPTFASPTYVGSTGCNVSSPAICHRWLAY